MGKRAKTACDIPTAGRLDFDHFGPQASQDFGAEGARDMFAEVENTNVA